MHSLSFGSASHDAGPVSPLDVVSFAEPPSVVGWVVALVVPPSLDPPSLIVVDADADADASVVADVTVDADVAVVAVVPALVDPVSAAESLPSSSPPPQASASTTTNDE